MMAAPQAASAGLPPSVVEFSLEGPRPQRRATVAFRWLLALPHLLYLAVLVMVAYGALFFGWLAALVTGRLPAGIATFVARVVGYSARVNGYGSMLLTDRYPAFSLDDDADYPIAVSLPEGGRLNRLAVLFRLILLLPAFFVTSMVLGGYSVVAVFVWLIVFVSGRLPTSLFEAEAATLRYATRTFAFAAMLTSDYPRGLFGDKDRSSPLAPPSPAVPVSPAAVPVLPPGAVSVLPPAAVPGPPDVMPWPPGPPISPSSSATTIAPAAPRITRLILSKAAKRIIVAFLVLGVVGQVGSISLSAATVGERVRTINRLDADQLTLHEAALEFRAASTSCAVQGGLQCLKTAIAKFRVAFTDYREDLRATDLPAQAVSYADDLDTTTADIISSLNGLLSISNTTAFQTELARFEALANEFDAEYLALRDAVLGRA
jgi:hypothetical protein